MNNEDGKLTTGDSSGTVESGQKKKKVSLADFKVKTFVAKVKVEQMQFLKTAGG